MTDRLYRAKRIAQFRTKGAWKHDLGNADIEGPHPERLQIVVRGEDNNYFANLEFISLMGSVADEMLAVIEAAKNYVSNDNVLNDLIHVSMRVIEIEEALKRLDTALAKHLGDME